MSNQTRRVVVEGDALKRLQQERAQQVDGYLEQLGNITTIKNQALDLVLAAELGQDSGVPMSDAAQDAILERCVRMAGKIAHERLKRYNQGVADICELMNVRDMPDHIRWAAINGGGVKLPSVEAEATESKLVTSH